MGFWTQFSYSFESFKTNPKEAIWMNKWTVQFSPSLKMIFSFLLALLFQLFISTTWGYDKVCDKVTVNIEINFKSVEIDPYCCAKNFLFSVWKPDDSIPREVSRHAKPFCKWWKRNRGWLCIISKLPVIVCPKGQNGNTIDIDFQKFKFCFKKIEGIHRCSHRRCSVKKVFLKILQNSQETPVPESLF